jgi:hypothetical protein
MERRPRVEQQFVLRVCGRSKDFFWPVLVERPVWVVERSRTTLLGERRVLCLAKAQSSNLNVRTQPGEVIDVGIWK